VAPNPEAARLVGALINRKYRLTGVLGEGGLGWVFEARGPNDERLALKLLQPEFCSDADVVARFLTELQAARRIAHPGVVQILEADRAEDGTPYLVMELCLGYALNVPMNRGRMPVDQVVAIGRKLLDALGAAHAVQVIHRDLKPENIFVQPEGELSVKILDFGLSRVIDIAGGHSRQTRTGVLLGTPGYMSPEQVQNSKAVDHRTDLFSTGILLYEMLSGVRAVQGDSPFERTTAVLFRDVSSIETVAPQFAHWAPFFARALARNPDQRFQSAAEMSEELEKAARGESRPSRAPPTDQVPGAQASRAPGSKSAQASTELLPSVPPAGPAPLASSQPALQPARVATPDPRFVTKSSPKFRPPGEAAVEAPDPVVPIVDAPRFRRVPSWLVGVGAGVGFLVGIGVGLWLGWFFS
jgi:eukaryotic-like serine/threonine-protein kinase